MADMNILNQLDLFDTCRRLHRKVLIFLKYTWNIHQHAPGYEISLLHLCI